MPEEETVDGEVYEEGLESGEQEGAEADPSQGETPDSGAAPQEAPQEAKAPTQTQGDDRMEALERQNQMLTQMLQQFVAQGKTPDERQSREAQTPPPADPYEQYLQGFAMSEKQQAEYERRKNDFGEDYASDYRDRLMVEHVNRTLAQQQRALQEHYHQQQQAAAQRAVDEAQNAIAQEPVLRDLQAKQGPEWQMLNDIHLAAMRNNPGYQQGSWKDRSQMLARMATSMFATPAASPPSPPAQTVADKRQAVAEKMKGARTPEPLSMSDLPKGTPSDVQPNLNKMTGEELHKHFRQNRNASRIVNY
ncbi:MAG: hypothetical protein HQL95_00610 [Magnetococcales bacterium]|nr:hypothetical protein [Magnetococcales bacterium]